MSPTLSRGKLAVWQFFFVFLSTTWLLAPGLNHFLSDRTTLISQYEIAGQPYAWLFRLGDLLGGLLLVWLVLHYYRQGLKSLPTQLLLIIGAGMALDPIFTTSCHVVGSECQESFSLTFLVHAVESIVTAFALVVLSVYDAKRRQRLPSIAFVVFQAAYGILFLTQYASHEHFNSVSQYVYQSVLIIWLAWFVRDGLYKKEVAQPSLQWPALFRYAAAGWVMLNGLLSIMLSLKDIHLFGHVQGLYFSGDTAWLAQHGVIVGVIMLYLSRHLLRGERRARQLLLIAIGIEVLKYAVITPSWIYALPYGISFCLLFAAVDNFRRGSLPLTWQVRLRDLAYMICVLLFAAVLALIVLDQDARVSRIANRTVRHFSYYVLHSDRIHRTHKESVLLADTAAAFFMAGTGSVLWILFKPYKLSNPNWTSSAYVRNALERYSHSSEDFFKLWPRDKQYFWDKTRQEFIAYKVAGSIAFALADPIGETSHAPALIGEFTEWARERRLKACFLPVMENSLELYRAFSQLQIGASALIDSATFTEVTIRDKWWRWKQNRAIKQGYYFTIHQPPHADDLLKQLKAVSDDWLTKNNHQERGFALGYFSRYYLQQCTVYCLSDQKGEIVAFTNQLPSFNKQTTATVDLIRHRTTAIDAMPYLLSEVIKATYSQGYRYFDLGFVPFASTKGLLSTAARAVSENRFSAKGLRQFKNKFNPNWQNAYLVYDGDLADLAAITIHLESVMKKSL